MSKIDIYTDGSFVKGNCGFGAVLLDNGTIIHEIYGSVADRSLLAHRQVAGEIAAVVESLNWCIKNGILAVRIHFDYQGVESWATGKWKTNTEMTARYAEYFKSCSVDITWSKVKAHTGDKWNEYADKLAKTGAAAAASPRKSPQKTDVKFSDAFSEYLLSEGIPAYDCGVLNNLFSRIEIRTFRREGIIDIYKKNDGFKLDLRAFTNTELQKQIVKLWENFLLSESAK